jgi:hypothetical protein
MKKYLAFTAVTATLALSPLLSGVHADQNGFSPLMANGAWNYGTYRVEKLAFSDAATGPFKVGDAVFVAEPTATAGLYDLTMIKDGMGKTIPNVPASAFTAKRIAQNGDRLVFARPTSDDALRDDVIEVSTVTGEETVLAKGVFAQNAEDVSVVVSGKAIFFEFGYAPTATNGLRQQGVFVWDPAASQAYAITQHWELNREEIEDVSNGNVLVKMTFPGGNKQLWVMTHDTVDGYRGAMSAIPGTWTDPNEDLVDAHFLADGSVEYFRNFARTTYAFADAAPVAHAGETITWFRPVNEAFQSDASNLTWIDDKDGLHAANGAADAQALGTAAFGRFRAVDGKVYFATDHGGKVATRKDGTFVTTDLPVGVTDVSGTQAIGLNGQDQVATLDLTTGVAHDVGTGSSPVIGTDGRAYWRGTNGGIYQVAFTTLAAAGVNASKDASGHFAKGALVKFAGSPTVFVVGSDRSLNSIPDEETALVLFGPDWDAHVIEVSQMQMIDYPLGGVVRTTEDLAKI